MDIEDPLLAEYRKTFPEKFRILREHLNVLKRDKSLDALSLFRLVVHKIAGSSGTYGFMIASKLCKDLDLELQDKIKNFNQVIFASEWFASLDAFLKQLEKALEKPDVKIKF
jgi:HPt (histidine-containing phosphotransfer) domain-containing protein